MDDIKYVYNKAEQLMNARRMVGRAQMLMQEWDFRGVKETIDLLARQLKYMQDNEA